MKITELPVDTKVSLMKEIMEAVEGWRNRHDSYHSGSIELYEYQPDTFWYKVYGMQRALEIQYGDPLDDLRRFLTWFGEMTARDEQEYCSDDDLLEILCKAFDVSEEEYYERESKCQI